MAATICPIELPSCYACLGCVLGHFVDVLDAEVREFRAKTIEIDTQFALAQPLARLFFLRATLLAELRYLCSVLARNHNHAVGIGHHDIAGIYGGARAHNRNIHRSGTRLHRTLRGDALGPDRELHYREIRRIAHAGVDNESNNTVRAAGDAEQ